MSLSAVDDYLKELSANASWYEHNSNYFDPMLQYIYKIRSEFQRNAHMTFMNNNFSLVYGTAYVKDVSPILYYGSIPCSTPGKEAYMDSALSCAMFQLPYFLEKIQFGYLCGLVLIPIMLISIFGGIKESYRWFLLNQAIWDAFMCYSFICEKPTLLAWSGGNPTCFYSKDNTRGFVDIFYAMLKGSFRNAPYIPLFLLAFSRCISLYFPKFYQRHNQTWKIITFIIFFDILIMVLSTLPQTILKIVAFLSEISRQNCFNTFCSEFLNLTQPQSQCSLKNEKFFQCDMKMSAFYNQFSMNSRYSNISITPVMFVFVIICVVLLLTKVSMQLNYQLKHNRYAFLKTIKVAAIILIQSITLSFYLIITSFQTYYQLQTGFSEYIADMRVYEKLSPAMFLLQHFATTTSINIIRIFFDSFIVIAVLSGYRKRIFRFFAFFIFYIKKPFHKLNHNKTHIISTTAVKTLR